MDNSVAELLVDIGYLIGSEGLSCLLLVFCYASILFLWRFFGVTGLIMYNVLAVIVANIQVLKTTELILSSEPVALGTLLFASTFLVSDILTEHKGLETAKVGIRLSFFAQIFMTVFMLITVAYPVSFSHAPENIQLSFETIFIPSLRILIASLCSFYISQLLDIRIFKYLKDYMYKKHMWFRVNVATLLSGLVDNIIFSVLAWVVLNPDPVSLKKLILVYILGTYGARIIVSITSTPIIYLTYKFRPLLKL